MRPRQGRVNLPFSPEGNPDRVGLTAYPWDGTLLYSSAKLEATTHCGARRRCWGVRWYSCLTTGWRPPLYLAATGGGEKIVRGSHQIVLGWDTHNCKYLPTPPSHACSDGTRSTCIDERHQVLPFVGRRHLRQVELG